LRHVHGLVWFEDAGKAEVTDLQLGGNVRRAHTCMHAWRGALRLRHEGPVNGSMCSASRPAVAAAAGPWQLQSAFVPSAVEGERELGSGLIDQRLHTEQQTLRALQRGARSLGWSVQMHVCRGRKSAITPIADIDERDLRASEECIRAAEPLLNGHAPKIA
jgi:hypothetical protein